MPRREDHEIHKGHVVALEKKKRFPLILSTHGINTDKRLLYKIEHAVHDSDTP
jgi:hypothetical protein